MHLKGMGTLKTKTVSLVCGIALVIAGCVQPASNEAQTMTEHPGGYDVDDKSLRYAVWEGGRKVRTTRGHLDLTVGYSTTRGTLESPSTLPFGSRVAVCWRRGTFMDSTAVQVSPAAGSNSSASA